MENDQHILLDITNGLATLVLNRPEKLNAFNARMHEQMQTALSTVAGNERVRCMLLSARGRGFCAGQDLSERKSGSGETARDLSKTIEATWNPLARALDAIRVPTICALNGVAAGAGIGIALSCDVVIAARSATFVQSFGRIGLVPDTGLTHHLSHLLGTTRAMGFALLGETITAEQAEEWGLIWKCVDNTLLAQTAQDVADRICAGPTLAHRASKRALKAAPRNSLNEQLELERELQRGCGFSADYREGVLSFYEKRPARFSGT